MRTVNFIELTSMENLDYSYLFAMNQRWRDGQIFTMAEPRGRTAILWLSACSVTVRPKEGGVFHFPRKALVCIPEGSEYTLEFHECTEEYCSILVDASYRSLGEHVTLTEGITVLSESVDDVVADALKKLVRDFSVPFRNYLEIKSDLFSLLSLIARRGSKTIIKEKFASIEKGIKYLERDDKQELTIDEVAKMCFVTPAYFRRMFRKYSGLSPVEYRNMKRTERAKELLVNPELSIEEISDLLGYESPSYFSRSFKSSVGITPSAYRKTKN